MSLNRLYFYGICAFISAFCYLTYGQELRDEDSIVWCTVNIEEQYKCNNLTKAIERDRQLFSDKFLNLSCLRAFDKDECMSLLDSEEADITSLDSGEVFVAGRFHSLVPILQETQLGGYRHAYSVAVVKKGSSVGNGGLHNLRGARACFPAVGTYAGWVLPVHKLMTEGGMEIIDCNNHVKSVTNFFGPSCAPNSLIDKYNPIGDNSDKLCELCTGRTGVRCSLGDPYAGFTGALRCLMEAGDIAFLKHTTIPFVFANHREFSTQSPDRFELLCKDGSRRLVGEYLNCNWGKAPSNAVVTSTAKNEHKRKRYQRFLQKIIELYSNQANVPTLNNSTDLNRQRNPDGSFSRDRDQYGFPIERDQYGNVIEKDQYGNPVDQFGNARSRDQFGREAERDQYGNLIERDQFGNAIEKDQYGNVINNDDFYNRRFGGSTSSSTTENSFLAQYGPRVIEKFDVFDSARYGLRSDLLFDDSSRGVMSLAEDKQQLSGFLGIDKKPVLEIRACPVNSVSLCVTSDAELEKCIKMRTAMKAQLLKPELVCYKGHSHIHCMQAIQNGQTDVMMLDAADVWEGARHYELEPFLSEVYGLGETHYYAVAVAKEQDADTEITFLRGKNTCHSGINTAAGWVYPLAYLISNGWIRPYGCDAARAAAEWFSRSCVPGAVSPEYNAGVPNTPLCRLCHGASFRHCRRDASEPYYGSVGALRCLIEGGGDVAFVKHSTVAEISGGRRREFWARNSLRDDFQLLCPDGTRALATEFKRCNLGQVPANAMVTRGGSGHNETQIKAYTNLFLYAQQFYGATAPDEFSFSMFLSNPPHTDLIFSDAARQLRPLTGLDRSASHYLGRVFMRAHHLTDCSPSTSKAVKSIMPYTLVIISAIAALQLFLH